MLLPSVHLAFAFVALSVHRVAANEINVSLDDCTVEIANKRTFGQSDGAPWCGMRIKAGAFANGLKAWSSPESPEFGPNDEEKYGGIYSGHTHIRGLEISYTDGNITKIGDQSGWWYSEVRWDPEKTYVEWMTGRDVDFVIGGIQVDPNPWLNYFKMKLSDGQFFCAGDNPSSDGGKMGQTSCKDEKPEDARDYISGQILGFSGRTGTGMLEDFTVYMLKSDVEGTEIFDVELSPSIEELNHRAQGENGVTKQTVLVGHLINDLDNGTVTYTVGADHTFTNTKTHTTEISNAWHVGNSFNFEYEWGLPVSHFKVGVTVDYSWERTSSKLDTETNTETKTLKWATTVPVQTKKAVRVEAYTIEGKMDLTWTGKMRLTLKENGIQFTFGTGGTLKDTLYSDSKWLVTNEPIEKARSAIAEGDGNELDVNGNPKPMQSVPSSKLRARSFEA